MSNHYIGLISGTSMDGVDVVLASESEGKFTSEDFFTLGYDSELLEELKRLCLPGEDEINRSAKADRQVARTFADAVQQILNRNGLTPSDIKLVGSHGQTIRHFPNGESGFSVQIGDPNTIAALCDIDVVADFRKKDIALGGQGAPLVPAFHHAVFASNSENRVILNIGGIANISYLPMAATTEQVLGFDTGPGNRLLDAWIQQNQGNVYDKNGEWAKTGQADKALLKSLLSLPYFSAPAPKSTGREQFNLEWLQQLIQVQPNELSGADVQATLMELTVQSIVDQINLLPAVDSVYVCGGGAHNIFMMQRLMELAPEFEWHSTEKLAISPDAVEALAFAWLAYAFEHNIKGNIPKVTGAARPAVLGGLYKAN